MSQIKYVVGFMFSASKNYVVLIKKNRPAWQKGFLNGVGGKIEPGESPESAMVREFYEETGVNTVKTDWNEFAVMEGDHAKIHVFKAISNDACAMADTKTDEIVDVFNVWDVPNLKIVPNLKWLVPMAAYDKVLKAEVKFVREF